MRAVLFLLMLSFLSSLLFAAEDNQLRQFNVSVEAGCRESGQTFYSVFVRSESGTPLNGVFVQVLQLEDGTPRRQVFAGNTEEGKVEFDGCEASYRVRVSYGGYETKTLNFEARSCECTPPPSEPPAESEAAPEEQPEEESPQGNGSEQPSQLEEQPSSPSPSSPSSQSSSTPPSQPPPLPSQPSSTPSEVEFPEPPSSPPNPICCLPPAFVLMLAFFYSKKRRK